MTKRFWIVGGEYEDPNFRALIPGSEKMVGPFESEQRARTEWTRLTYCPDSSAMMRYSIATETVH
ncbi:MAG: hypothetical protein JWP15_2279 [Alphaproteobacteria bacterium]|nr:hypothetical protein [Alphaproteobacteria bacterium]